MVSVEVQKKRCSLWCPRASYLLCSHMSIMTLQPCVNKHSPHPQNYIFKIHMHKVSWVVSFLQGFSTNLCIHCSFIYMRLTIKFVNSPWYAYIGSSGQKTQYALMKLAFQCFTAVVFLICGSLLLSSIYYCPSVFRCAIMRMLKEYYISFWVPSFTVRVCSGVPSRECWKNITYLSEYHLLLSECVLVCRHENVERILHILLKLARVETKSDKC
jgi:hypothetical protein